MRDTRDRAGVFEKLRSIRAINDRVGTLTSVPVRCITIASQDVDESDATLSIDRPQRDS